MTSNSVSNTEINLDDDDNHKLADSFILYLYTEGMEGRGSGTDSNMY